MASAAPAPAIQVNLKINCPDSPLLRAAVNNCIRLLSNNNICDALKPLVNTEQEIGKLTDDERGILRDLLQKLPPLGSLICVLVNSPSTVSTGTLTASNHFPSSSPPTPSSLCFSPARTPTSSSPPSSSSHRSSCTRSHTSSPTSSAMLARRAFPEPPLAFSGRSLERLLSASSGAECSTSPLLSSHPSLFSTSSPAPRSAPVECVFLLLSLLCVCRCLAIFGLLPHRVMRSAVVLVRLCLGVSVGINGRN